MGSSDQVIIQLEQAAQRCDQAVALFDEAVEQAKRAVFPQKILERAAAEAKKAFEAVHKVVLPVIDAIEAANKSAELASQFKTIRDLTWKHSPRALKKRVADRFLTAAKNGSVPVDPQARLGIELMASVYGVMSPRVRLSRLGECLRYAAGHLRTTYALQPPKPTPQSVHHHHGDTHMGDKYTVTNTNSTIGAQAVGDNATATGHVTVGATATVTQEEHKAAIQEAQTALVRDQDALERIDDRLYEALGQFLTLARKIQVEQQSLAEVQAKVKETLDEVWAQQAAKGLRPQALPEGLKVIEVLGKSPITAEVAKKLLGA